MTIEVGFVALCQPSLFVSAVHLRKGEQKADEFTSLNPNQTVPVLIENGITLHQSMAIIEYLEETRPNHPLLPKSGFIVALHHNQHHFKLLINFCRDAAKRAQVRAIALMIAADIQPLQNLRVLANVSPKPEEKSAYARNVINEGFQRLEKALGQCAGTYAVGDDVTMADLFVVPQVYNAIRFEVDMTKYPIISRVNQACLALDAFKKAMPEAQPDAEQL